MLPCWCFVVLAEIPYMKKRRKSCTSGPKQWLEPKGIKQVPYLELGSIDFTSANKSMEEFHIGTCEHDSVEKSVVSNKTQPPDEDIVQLFEKCSSSEKVPILFFNEDQPYCKSFSKSTAHLPLAFQSLFPLNNTGMVWPTRNMFTLRRNLG